MRIVPFIILLFIILCIIVVFCVCKKENYTSRVKGICYFDIDGTLTSSQNDRNDLIKQCLDNNFAVGIITASGRRIHNVCDGDRPIVPWMPSTLCKQFNKNRGMYNSTTVLAGKSLHTEIPSDYPLNESPGYVKGYAMAHGRDKFYPNVPDKCVVLFDDQISFMKDVHRFNPNFETQCANKICGLNGMLTSDIVRNKIRQMQLNGCGNN